MNKLIDIALAVLVALLDRTGTKWKTPVAGFLLAGVLALHQFGMISNEVAAYLFAGLGTAFGISLIHRAARSQYK